MHAWIGLDLLASVTTMHDIIFVVYFVASFCFRLVPSCLSSFALCLFKSSVLVARFSCTKSALGAFRFMNILGRFVFLISCLSDALGLWGGLRPGSGVSFGASVVMGGFYLCAVALFGFV